MVDPLDIETEHRQVHRPATGDSECVCGGWVGPMTSLSSRDPRSFVAHVATQVLHEAAAMLDHRASGGSAYNAAARDVRAFARRYQTGPIPQGPSVSVAPDGPSKDDALLAHLVARATGEVDGDDCELTGFSGSGRCIETAVALRWENGFADLVCAEHATRAEQRGSVVAYPAGAAATDD